MAKKQSGKGKRCSQNSLAVAAGRALERDEEAIDHWKASHLRFLRKLKARGWRWS